MVKKVTKIIRDNISKLLHLATAINYTQSIESVTFGEDSLEHLS